MLTSARPVDCQAMSTVSMSMSILSVSQVPAFTSVSPRHQLFNTGGTELCGILSLEQFAGNLVLSPQVISDVMHFTHVHRISSDFIVLFIVFHCQVLYQL